MTLGTGIGIVLVLLVTGLGIRYFLTTPFPCPECGRRNVSKVHAGAFNHCFDCKHEWRSV